MLPEAQSEKGEGWVMQLLWCLPAEMLWSEEEERESPNPSSLHSLNPTKDDATAAKKKTQWMGIFTSFRLKIKRAVAF